MAHRDIIARVKAIVVSLLDVLEELAVLAFMDVQIDILVKEAHNPFSVGSDEHEAALWFNPMAFRSLAYEVIEETMKTVIVLIVNLVMD